MPQSIHESEICSQEQELTQVLHEEWHERLVPLLPAQREPQAKALKAFERAQGLRTATDLLRGILAYAFCLSSFRQVGCWAASRGLSRNGERSWAKRTRQARLWLLWLLQELLSSARPDYELPTASSARVLLVDASLLRGWRKQAQQCRLHVSYDLQARCIAQVVLSDQHQGERLTTFRFERGDILVADRGYCRRQAIWDVLQAGGQVVVRLHWHDVPLQHEDGQPVDLNQWVGSLTQDSAELPVWMQVRKQRVRVRLLAQRLTPEAAQRARRKHKRRVSKNGIRQPHPWSAVLADWLLVLTSLEATAWPHEHVLQLYRARWQIELLFKRIKQLVRIHRLRSSHQHSNEATVAALLVGWALMERQASQLRGQLEAVEGGARAGRRARPSSSWEVDAVLVQSMRSMILGPWSWQQIQQRLDQIARVLTCHPQARVQQESAILQQLDNVLAVLQT